jgi:hypothetical protein
MAYLGRTSSYGELRWSAVTLAAIVVTTQFVIVACDESPCAPGCETVGAATFLLSCSPNDLTSVTVSGPCGTADASLSPETGREQGVVAILSPSPGVCHIELTFSTGFTYASDVTFTSQSVCSCPSFIGPTGGPFVVDIPGSACVDAGADTGSED